MKLLSRNENGQALVEFALVVPILLLILCGIIDFGWMFFNQLSLQNACREGGRYASLNSTDANIETTITTMVQDYIPGSLQNLNVKVTYTNASKPTDGDVKVEVEANVEFFTPVLGTVYRNGRTMTDEIVYKVES